MMKVLDEHHGRVVDLLTWQHKTLSVWRGLGFYLDGAPGDTQKYSIANEEEGFTYITVIEPYFIYKETWRKSGFENPFEFDWTRFNPKSSCDVAYLEFVIGVMDEQIEIWGTNQASSFHIVFINFNTYIESLKHFFCWVCGIPFESEVTVLAPANDTIEKMAVGFPSDWGLDDNDLFI